ncbi:VOC family protein [Aliiroseovarius subalbicans]|uniref:VOC family protein n=1 Tax=Aliiroseovarius subalbicans TaxID=2925840 RepID=UPI001F574256|nr:VOC family protein [Aliiroseovarius subalbicans]MCI2400722.1 VOC family protein [Aliiroseovarius subalbicans]
MTHTPTNPVVWTEIPVTDMTRAVAFYDAVFGYQMKIDSTGPNPMAMFPAKEFETGVAGHLYPGKPAAQGTGPTVHLAIPDTLDAAKARLVAAGGTLALDGLVIEIPAGQFCYATDPDGNSIGLFEPKG